MLGTLVTVTPEAWDRERYCPERIVPPGWRKKSPLGSKTETWQNGTSTVLRSVAEQADGKLWMHLSMSRRDGKVPTWDQLRELKEMWAGDVEGYVVFPPKARYVNLHPGVLHLWVCVDEPNGVLPDFSQGIGSI